MPRQRRRRARSRPCNAPSANVLCVGATDSNAQLDRVLELRAQHRRTCSRLGNAIASAWMEPGRRTRRRRAVDGRAARHRRARTAQSDNPSAPASALRAATLASVDPLAALTATSVSGGRLNAAAALAAPPVTPVATPVPQAPASIPSVPVKRPAARLTSLRAATRATGHAKPQVTYSVSHAATVTFTIRQRACAGGRGRATATVHQDRGPGPAFVRARRTVSSAAPLRPGRYVLRAAVGHGSRQARFTVHR